VFADLSLHGKPKEWARVVVEAYKRFGANVVVAEANNGGDMVESVIHAEDGNVRVKLVHASRGKHTRAEPISTLAERGLIHHVGSFPELEDQMSTFVPGEPSPDNMDAMVWAMTELLCGAPMVSLDDAMVFGESVMSRGPWG